MWKQKLQVDETQKRDGMGILKAKAQESTFDKGHAGDRRDGAAFKNSEGKFSSQQPPAAVHVSLSLQPWGLLNPPRAPGLMCK